MYRDWVRDRNLNRDAYWIGHGFLNRDWVWLRNVNGIRPVYRDGNRDLDRDWNFLLDGDWIRLWNWNFDFLGYSDGLHFTLSHRDSAKAVIANAEVSMATDVKATGSVTQAEDSSFLCLRVFLLFLFR
jgi:hypothetical protein